MFVGAVFTITKIWKPMSINIWMDRENVVHTNNGILFSLKKKKEILQYTSNEWTLGHYAKGNNPDTERKMLHDSTDIRYLK